MNWHCYLLGMYVVAAEATLMNFLSARWLHNNTHTCLQNSMSMHELPLPDDVVGVCCAVCPQD
jgi:hypothetical protein